MDGAAPVHSPRALHTCMSRLLERNWWLSPFRVRASQIDEEAQDSHGWCIKLGRLKKRMHRLVAALLSANRRPSYFPVRARPSRVGRFGDSPSLALPLELRSRWPNRANQLGS